MRRVYDNKAPDAIKTAPLEPAYLFGGEDGYMLGRAIARLTDRVLGGASRDFNLDIYNGMDNSANDVVSAALSMPMMADRRVVILKAADKLRKFDPITEYLESPSPTTVLILAAEGAERFKIESMARPLSAGIYVFFGNPTEDQMARRIAALATELGYKMELGAADYIRDMVGGSMSLAESEVKKVINHVGGKKSISLDDVTDAVGDFGLPVIFKIADALASRDVSSAVMMFAKLHRDGTHPLQVLALLAGHWRKLLSARDMLDAGVPKPEIASKLRLNNFNRSSIFGQAGNISAMELSRGLRLFSEADRRFKSAALPDRVELEMLFLNIAGGR
jgi:DNA polymerase-3 subunit delta